MVITTVQKVIKIGSSRGVTLPIRDGDEIEVTVRKRSEAADDNQVLKTANSLLERYKEDFSHLAKR